MGRITSASSSLTIVVLLCSLPLHANVTCKLRPLMHQRRDIATVQHLEDEWSRAYLRGDTDLERCLLAADFTEILRTGEVKVLADELELAAKNRGKNLAVPDLPKTKILLHGNVAVAYGISSSSGSNSKARTTRFADSYLWENGAWHVFFAQQTQFENNQSAGTP